MTEDARTVLDPGSIRFAVSPTPMTPVRHAPTRRSDGRSDTSDAGPGPGIRALLQGALDQLMTRGVQLHQAGDLGGAQAAFTAVLQEQPEHPLALHNLSVLALETGDLDAALAGFAAAVQLRPHDWQFRASLVDAWLQGRAPWAAVHALEDARQVGMPPEAIGLFMPRLQRAVLDMQPGETGEAPPSADLAGLVGLLNQGRMAELVRRARGVVDRHPGNVLAWRLLAQAAERCGDDASATEAWEQVCQLCPQDADAWIGLGLVVSRHARLLPAELAFRAAACLAPRKAVAHCNLGFVLQRRGQLAEALEALERSVAIEPEFAVACVNLSVVHDERGDAVAAEHWARRALAIEPQFVHALNTLGYLLKDQGRIDEALQFIDRALRVDPRDVTAHSNRLFLLNYHPNLDAGTIRAAYAEYDRVIGQRWRQQWRPHANPRHSERRLRVGYVSPGFYRHSTRFFLAPLIEGHDRSGFELFAYAEAVASGDEVSVAYRTCFDHWIETAGLDDDALAERVRSDGIDILIDVAGHTRGNRLGVFARKPAPVSLHWLDFGSTTGLTAIDYYLADEATAPPGSDALFAESPWRMDGPSLVYRPPEGMGDVGPLPALRAGHVCFGTLTRAIRINAHTIRVWAEILRRVPGSVLIVDSSNFRTSKACSDLVARFAAHGIEADRLQVGCHSPPWDLLRRIDIGLDCFPHNSGTTLFEMLHQGVPFVTLAGRPSVGRVGSMVLQAMGAPEWIATDEADYVDRVVRLAGDLDALAAVRSGLRARVKASALMDEAGFARRVEAAYRQMFARWCASTPAEVVRPPSPADPMADLLQRAVAQTMALALAHHRAGELESAAELYREILQTHPAHADANHNLAVIALEAGRAGDAVALFERAWQARPGDWQTWLSYFDGLLQAGRLPDATRLLESRRRSGLSIPVTQELVQRLVDGRFQRLSAQSVATPERLPKALSERIDAHFRLGRMADVVGEARKAVRRHPKVPYGWKALGAALVNLGEFEAALEPLQQAADLAGSDAGALSNLGFALHNQRRPVEAEVNLRLALRLKPGFASAIINLGSALLGQDRFDEAATLYEQGLDLEPGYIPAHSHLAQLRDEQGRLIDAVEGYRRTLDLLSRSGVDLKAARFDVTLAHAHQGLASTLAKLSDFAEVEQQSDAAIAVRPDDMVLWEKRLYALSYHPDLPVERIFSEFVRWGDRFPMPQVDFSRHDRTVGRRLRVGYVSPDFRRHTSRFYFLPFFANHDAVQVELFAYANVKVEDEYTQRFREVFHHWRDIRDLSDEAVAEQVRADRIDILVDGCNHMRDDRLGVFTLKPAPLQVTWLGAAWTTGLRQVDYVLFDPYIAPPETLAREAIVRLPHCFVPFQSMIPTEEPQAPPCLANGHVTFAYSGRTERLNHRTFRVWGEILRRVPGSVLILDFRSFADPRNRAHFTALMAHCGLDPSRVVMRNSSDIFKALHDFDILLDCFPHSGGTMLVDALWMGVPALTWAARPPLGRIGTTFVSNIGLADWVAHSEAEYIDKAVAFAGDVSMRTALRAGMRRRMLDSPLMDGRGFARGVEAAYREMWRRFCAGEPVRALTVGPDGSAA